MRDKSFKPSWIIIIKYKQKFYSTQNEKILPTKQDLVLSFLHP